MVSRLINVMYEFHDGFMVCCKVGFTIRFYGGFTMDFTMVHGTRFHKRMNFMMETGFTRETGFTMGMSFTIDDLLLGTSNLIIFLTP